MLGYQARIAKALHPAFLNTAVLKVSKIKIKMIWEQQLCGELLIAEGYSV